MSEKRKGEQKFDSETENPKHDHESKVSLSQVATGVAAGLAVAEKSEAQDAQELKRKRLEYDPYFTEPLDHKIDFSKNPEILTPSEKKFIADIVRVQNMMVDLVPMEQRLGVGQTDKTTVMNVDETNKMRQVLWGILSKRLPAGQSYSTQDLNYILVYELPVWLSKYGILAKPYIINLEQQGIYFDPLILNSFFRVSKFQRELIFVGNQSLQRDLLTTEPYDSGIRELVRQRMVAQFDAEHLFQNVILNPEDKSADEVKGRSYDFIRNHFKNVSENQHLTIIADSSDPRAQAGMLANYKILSRYSNEYLLRNIREEQIAHETGHVSFSAKRPALPMPKPPHSPQLRAFFVHEANYYIHHEIEAQLVEFRLGRFKEKILFKCLSYLQTGVQENFYHDEAVNWCIDRFVNIIKQNPKHYGMTLDQTSKVSTANQIILQLPDLLGRPQLFEELADKAMEIHQNNYGQDFSAKYFRFRGLSVPADLPNTPLIEPQYIEEEKFPWPMVGVGAVAAVGVTGGAIAMHRLGKRKELVRLEERLPKILRGIKGQRVDVNGIIKGIQFGAKKSEIDVNSRLQALADLRRLGQGQIAEFLEKRLASPKKKKE